MKTFKHFSEKMDMKSTSMGDVIKDFQQSDAPQFAGKSKEKRRQMAIAAKMQAEGTIQSNGTDKIEIGCDDVATKKKTDKEMKDAQQNESWGFDTAAMAKQELADAKNKKHRKRGKVANLLRKLGMKEEFEITESNFNAIMAQIKKKKEQAKREARIEAGKTQDNSSGAWGKLTPKDLARIERSKKLARNEEYELQEDSLLEYEISHDGNDNYRDDEGNEWSGKDKNRPRGSFARRHTITSKEPEHPHAVHINGKKWKSFGSHSHATNVAKKIKGATVHKEELNQEGILDKVKAVGKKALDTLTHGSDEDLRKDLQKKVGVPQTGQKPKKLREFIETLKEGKPTTSKEVNVDKVHAAGEKPHEEKWEAAKKVKKESFTADQLLQALKEGMWPGTPEYTAKFGNQAKQGGGAGVKKGSRYGGSLQKPEKEDDNDADDKPAKKPKNK